MPDEVSTAVFMNTHILQNNQSIADQVPAETTRLIQQVADENDGYWFREIMTFDNVRQGFFPVRPTQQMHVADTVICGNCSAPMFSSAQLHTLIVPATHTICVLQKNELLPLARLYACTGFTQDS